MVVDKNVLDELTAKAKENPRLRCNMDLRNSAGDNSQRMLNALEPGTVMPIHRHKGSSETCVCVRGHFEEYFYDENGVWTRTVDPFDDILRNPETLDKNQVEDEDAEDE